MSHDKRIREMMDRLVAMSPEPPPFPESTQQAVPPRWGRPHPVLLLAGGAAAVLLALLPIIYFSGGEDPEPVATSTTTTLITETTLAPTSTTTPASTSTTGSTATTVAVESGWSSVVYLVAESEASFLGNPALVPVWLSVTDPTGELSPDDYFTTALRVALTGGSLPDGLSSVVPEEVSIEDVTTTAIDGEQVWVLEMNEAFLEGAGGLLSDLTMINQIIYTVTQGTPEIPGVLFTVDGEPVEAFGTEGLDLTDPVDRETFIDHLALIFLTEPIIEVEHVYVVSGIANTFEAALAVRVLDGNGAVIHEEPVQATCGTGCWGEFGVGVASELIVPGESSIQLFTYSAEDGSMTDIVTVPIPVGDVWEVSGG